MELGNELEAPCKVMVLMSTYNGQRYLQEQLDSIYRQKDVVCSVYVRDDGSSDGTCNLLEWEQERGALKWYAGRNLGPAGSFWDLLLHAPQSEWYAFADQDDVWLEDKLESAISRMDKEQCMPCLYFGQTQLVDEELNPLKSVVIHPRLTYGEALMSQFVGGCTMVFNHALREKLLAYTPTYMRMHDVWVYDVALAIGAQVCFDAVPHILYRQHSSNAVGQLDSVTFRWRERMGRLRRYERIRSRLAEELWNGYADQMLPENRNLTRKVMNYRNGLNKVHLLVSGDLNCGNRMVAWMGKLSILFNLF